MSETILDLIASENNTSDSSGNEETGGTAETVAGKEETKTEVKSEVEETKTEDLSLESILNEKEWTPAKVQAAGKYLRGQTKAMGKAFAKADKQGKSAQRERLHYEEQSRRLQALVDQHNEDRKILREGDEHARAAAIKRLFNEDPLKFIEMMTLKIAGRDDLIKDKESKPETSALEAKIAELEKKMLASVSERKQQEEAKAAEATVLSFYERALSTSDERFVKAWPTIASLAAPTDDDPDRPQKAARELLDGHKEFANSPEQKGRIVTTDEFLDWAERQLRVKMSAATANKEQPKPRAPVRALAHKTVPRSVEQTSGTAKREMTATEYDDSIATFFGW